MCELHEKVWVDGCYDLFHYGHSNGLRQANLFGKKLIVGVHSNEAIQNNKGLPVMKDEERYEMVRSCRWVHEVVKSSPFVTDMKIVRSHGACLVMHANDQVLSSEGYDCYQEAKSEGMYREFERTLGISTTELVGRMLLRRNNAKVTVNNYVEYQENLAKEFIACMDKSPKINVIMIDGTFDLFHAGHVNTLKKAKELGGYLIIGLYSDESSKKLHGEYPVMTFLERKLVLLSCRYADEVIEIHPEITPNIIKELDIKIIAHGENKSSEFYSGISDLVKVIKISHSFSYLTNKVIIKRILENYKKYEERNINRLAI